MSYILLLKITDQRTKDIVFGYIRTLERLLKLNYSTPLQIQYCCLHYYFTQEYFTKCGDCMKLNEIRDTVCKSTGGGKFNYNSAYGNFVIDATKTEVTEYIWHIKLINVTAGYAYVGIDSSNKQYINSRFTDPMQNGSVFYGFRSDGYIDWNDKRGCSWRRYGSKCTNNDTITMIVNINYKNITFYVNEEDLGVAVANIEVDKIYNLGVNLYSVGQSVQILKFETK
eukprot:436508_1